MFRVVRRKTVRSQQDPHITLICINGSSTNASMGVYASQGDLFWRDVAENLLQFSSEKGAVALLDYDSILVVAGQI